MQRKGLTFHWKCYEVKEYCKNIQGCTSQDNAGWITISAACLRQYTPSENCNTDGIQYTAVWTEQTPFSAAQSQPRMTFPSRSSLVHTQRSQASLLSINRRTHKNRVAQASKRRKHGYTRKARMRVKAGRYKLYSIHNRVDKITLLYLWRYPIQPGSDEQFTGLLWVLVATVCS